MSDIVISHNNLPSTINDLSKFVLVGREKLVAVRAEIRAIEKVGLAQEVRKQKLREAQDISEAVLDAEVRIGELMARVPKATENQYTKVQSDSSVAKQKSKADVIRDAGFTPKQVQRFQQMAAHPQIVEKAKAEARCNDDIVSRSAVLSLIDEQKKPHVTNNSGCNEWYTPKKYINLVKKVLGNIDLDPASCDFANKIIQADKYYSITDDGLKHEWKGNIWMNPPYTTELVTKFTDKFIAEYKAGNIVSAIVLVNNATETTWFNNMINCANAVVFPKGRIRYESSTRESLAPLQGQAFLYFGNNVNRFLSVFSEIGWGAIIYHE